MGWHQDNDYRAVVNVFLFGGNDNWNTLVPYDQPNYDNYALARPSVALNRSSLAGTVLTPSVPLSGGVQYALHPNLSPFKTIWDAGKLAVIKNVGTLIEPMTKAQYLAGTRQLPPKLFSHNDQQAYWQSSAPEGGVTGWGGRMMDRLVDRNDIPSLTSINIGGQNILLAGDDTIQYAMSPGGPVPLLNNANVLYGSIQAQNKFRELMCETRANPLMAEFTRTNARALDVYDTISDALLSVGSAGNSVHPSTRMIAKMIKAAPLLGQTRQSFMVGFGSFDQHSALLVDHAFNLNYIAGMISTLFDFTVAEGFSDCVTIFTGSDFGRTLVTNGDGSDHAWGTDNFVLGGKVNGGRYYGTPPSTVLDSADDVGQGRLLPTTSVDQANATLAKWMGITSGRMPTVLPNIVNFTTKDLGFMAP